MNTTAYSNKDQQNLIYFYDLPTSVTKVKIAKVIKDEAGVDIDIEPQIKRDIGRHFYTAMVKINDQESFKKVLEKLKYPVIEGKQCRALPFNPEFLGNQKAKLTEKNVFVRKIPKNFTCKDLDEKFSKYGQIMSVKISLNAEHESNQYGFVCFALPEYATAAIQSTSQADECQGIKFSPKDKREFQKVFNNIYVKNFPLEWDKEEIEREFSPFGEILSCTTMTNDAKTLKFAFVCFGKAGSDASYGPSCAAKAVKEMHGKQFGDATLYVKPALSKSEREAEKIKEMIRYKNSKKRCNLYVKNFPNTTTSEELKTFFSKFGTIESIRLFPKEGDAVYAFVCFKSPEEASRAKNECHQQNFNGKMLYINHYEIKEVRKVQIEEMRDKADFQTHKKATANVSELMSRPEIYAILNQLIALIQPRLNKPYNNNRGGPRQGGYNQSGYQNRGPQGIQGPPGNAPGQQLPKVLGMPGQIPPEMLGQMRQGMPPQGIPQGMIPPNQQQLIQQQQRQQQYMMQQQQQMPPQMNNPQFGLHQQYLQKSVPLIPAVVPQNGNYKHQVGEVIFEFVEKIAGEDKAPKITGMLIDLPIEEIRQYLQFYEKLEEKVREANTLLSQGMNQ